MEKKQVVTLLKKVMKRFGFVPRASGVYKQHDNLIISLRVGTFIPAGGQYVVIEITPAEWLPEPAFPPLDVVGLHERAETLDELQSVEVFRRLALDYESQLPPQELEEAFEALAEWIDRTIKSRRGVAQAILQGGAWWSWNSTIRMKDWASKVCSTSEDGDM